MNYQTLKHLQKLDSIYKIHTGGDLFIENEQTLLKALYEDKRSMLSYLKTLPNHEFVIKPFDYGTIEYTHIPPVNERIFQSYYRMPYLKNAQTFLDCIYTSLPYEEKLKYCTSLFQTLKFLHQYIVLGDIHARNILVNQHQVYFIDLDNSRKKQDFWHPISCSFNLNSFDLNTKYTDILKLYVLCLSLFLEIDLTCYIKHFSYSQFCKVICSYPIPKPIAQFLQLNYHPLAFKNLHEEAYNFEQFFHPDLLTLKKELQVLNIYPPLQK